MRITGWLCLSAIIFSLDQITKWYAVNHLLGKPPVVVIPGFFDFSLTFNAGAAFGLLSDASGWQGPFFIVVAILVSVFIVYTLFTQNPDDIQSALAFSLILGGALGNLWDRIKQGYVVDFIHWFYQGWHWPTFNIADSAICIGATLLVMDIVGIRILGSRETLE